MQLEIYKDRTLNNDNTQSIKAAEALQSLVQYINDLTEIVNEIKIQNQAEFIIAYQSHMKKIKAELKELKYKTEEQRNNILQNQVKINQKDNELTLFREECLRLYEKIEQKNKENQELKFKLQEYKKTNEFLEQQTKGLIKKLKLQEVEKEQQTPPLIEQTFCTTVPANQFKFLKRKTTEQQQRLDLNSTLSKYHFLTIKEMFSCDESNNINQKRAEIIEKFTKYVTQLEQKYQKQIQKLNQKVHNLLISQNKKSIIRSDLEQFFLECVESVRRDILKKKRPFGNNQLQQSQSQNFVDFSQFYKEDKMKILELVVSNEKILVFLYQKLFPNHINLVIKSIREDININTFLDQSLKCNLQNNYHQNGDYKIDVPKTTREVRSASLNNQLEVKRGKILFKQY